MGKEEEEVAGLKLLQSPAHDVGEEGAQGEKGKRGHEAYVAGLAHHYLVARVAVDAEGARVAAAAAAAKGAHPRELVVGKVLTGCAASAIAACWFRAIAAAAGQPPER